MILILKFIMHVQFCEKKNIYKYMYTYEYNYIIIFSIPAPIPPLLGKRTLLRIQVHRTILHRMDTLSNLHFIELTLHRKYFIE